MNATMLPASTSALATSDGPALRTSIQTARRSHTSRGKIVATSRTDRQNDTSHAGRSMRRTRTPPVLKTAAAPTAHSTPSVELCRWSGVFISAQCVSVVPVPPSIDSLDLPPFRPRFPWWGADLQTIAILLQPAMSDMSPHTSERVLFPMADRSGDILLGMLDSPTQSIEGRPLVILVHGLTGCE